MQLIEICCDKFKKGSQKICFHKGLNVIKGEMDGKNSVGKSSFLLIIDFCFGGDAYAKNEDIKLNIKDHHINFCFSLNENKYYFQRYTGNPKVVYKANENYQPQYNSKITIDEFRKFLQEKYKIKNAGMDEISDALFRIDSKKNIDKKVSLELLLKLYDLYIEPPIIDESGCVISKNEYETNKANIEKLLKELLDEISMNKQFIGNTQIIARMEELKATQENLIKERHIWGIKYHIIKNQNAHYTPPKKDEFTELQKYFPNGDIKHFTEIESFHKAISQTLNSELQAAMDNIKKQLNYYDSQIVNVENQITDLLTSQKVPESILGKYNITKQNYEKIRDENTQYEIENDKIKKQKDAYEEKLLIKVSELKELIDKEIERLQPIIDPPNESPKFNANKITNYEYKTPNSDGRGTNYKNQILLDLILLLNTNLPALIQDTTVFDNIEYARIEKIIKEYSNNNKQIFIAIDKMIGYPKETQDIINCNTVLLLSFGRNSLYGQAFEEKPKVIEQMELEETK
jgi:hypothetical protein